MSIASVTHMTATIARTSFRADMRSEPRRLAIGPPYRPALLCCDAVACRAMAPGATDDPRAATWEKRFRGPIIVAALAVLPLLALSLTHPHGIWHTVEVAAHWTIWLVFFAEVIVMLMLVKDRR